MQTTMRKGDVAFWIAAGFLFGTFIAGEAWNLLVILPTTFIAIIISLWLSRSLSIWKYAAAIFVAIMFGVIYCHGYVHWISVRTHLPSGKDIAFLGFVTDDPEPAGNFILIKLALSRPYSGTLDIFASSNSQFHYGDIVWAKGAVTASNNTDEASAVFLPQLRLVTANNGFWLKQYAINAKSYIVQTLDRFFSADQAALLSAIIIGTSDTLSAGLKQQMNASGTFYIAGMYGYKIALIGLFLSGLLKDHISRKSLLLLTLVVIVLFIFFSGASISAIRAGIMGSLALLASALGRRFVARNALTFTAVVMSLFDPRIITEAAFQLSFLSYLGIYHLAPPLKRFFHWDNDGFLEWKQHAMLSLSTNVAIVPVVMNTFGGFSLTSFISNILIMIPWVLIIFFGLIIVAIGSFLPSFVFFLIPITNFLVAYELVIIRAFTDVVIPIPNIFTSVIAVIFYYGALLIFIYYYGETA